MSARVSDKIQPIAFGKARVCRPGTDVTVVTWGANMVAMAEEVAEQVSQDCVSVEVIDPRTLVPFDREAVVKSASKTGRLVVLQEAVRRCGFGAEIVATVADSEAFARLKAPMVRVANPGVPVAFSRTLQKYALPDSADLTAAIFRVMGRAKPLAKSRDGEVKPKRKPVKLGSPSGYAQTH